MTGWFRFLLDVAELAGSHGLFLSLATDGDLSPSERNLAQRSAIGAPIEPVAPAIGAGEYT